MHLSMIFLEGFTFMLRIWMYRDIEIIRSCWTYLIPITFIIVANLAGWDCLVKAGTSTRQPKEKGPLDPIRALVVGCHMHNERTINIKRERCMICRASRHLYIERVMMVMMKQWDFLNSPIGRGGIEFLGHGWFVSLQSLFSGLHLPSPNFIEFLIQFKSS